LQSSSRAQAIVLKRLSSSQPFCGGFDEQVEQEDIRSFEVSERLGKVALCNCWSHNLCTWLGEYLYAQENLMLIGRVYKAYEVVYLGNLSRYVSMFDV